MASENIKRDFGSFFSSNVQELIETSEKDYVSPKINISLPKFDDCRGSTFKFGKICKENHFYLDEDFTFINHGAFGAVLKDALEAAQAWQIYIEKQPVKFLDRELFPLLVYVTRTLAKFVNCAPSDLVLMPNVTSAINCIFRSQNFKRDDIVLSLTIEYGTNKKIIRQICSESGANWRELKLTMPINSKEDILKEISQGLSTDVKLVIVDHIPSNTPFIMPVKEIIDLCHQKNIRILVDGAHGLGAIDINLSSLDADYYTSNGHKWLCTPKGVAFMYVKKSLQSTLNPLIISHGFKSGFHSGFFWSGLKDYSPYLALLTVLDFWETVGPSKIRDYMYDLAQKAGKLLTDMWETDLLAPPEMFGSMTEVEIPTSLYEGCGEVNYSAAETVQNWLFYKYNIEVPIKAIDGKLYVRVSAHIYNEISDYMALGDAILDLTKKKPFSQK